MNHLPPLFARQHAIEGQPLPPPLRPGWKPGQRFSLVDGYLPVLLGAWIDSLLMGLTIVIFLMWWSRGRPTERPVFRRLVYWLFFTSAAASVWYMALATSSLVRNFGNFADIATMHYVRWFSLVVMSTRIPAMAFLLHRAYLFLDRQKWILALITPMMQVPIPWVAGINIACIIILRTVQDAPLAKRMLSIEAGLEALVDLTLAVVIGFGLRWPKTGLSRTDWWLSKAFRILVETQLPQVMVTLAFLAIAVSLPRTPAQFYVLFYPKISPILIMLVLMARDPMSLETRPTAFALNHNADDTEEQELRDEYDASREVKKVQSVKLHDWGSPGRAKGEGFEHVEWNTSAGSKVHLVG